MLLIIQATLKKNLIESKKSSEKKIGDLDRELNQSMLRMETHLRDHSADIKFCHFFLTMTNPVLMTK